MKRKQQTQSILPTETIQVGNNKINLNFEIQTSPTGKQMQYSGLETKNDIWIYSFRYLEGGFVYLPFFNGMFQRKLFEQYNAPNK